MMDSAGEVSVLASRTPRVARRLFLGDTDHFYLYACLVDLEWGTTQGDRDLVQEMNAFGFQYS